MKKRLYIAYGSNLNISQMRKRCPTARIVGTGELRDWRLLFKGSRTGAYLTIERQEGYTVPVAAWDVTAEDEEALDRYEGWPTFYYKEELLLPIRNASTGKTRNRRAFVYIMYEDRPIGIPSRFYVNTCLEGYCSFHFNEKLLAEALRFSMKEARK